MSPLQRTTARRAPRWSVVAAAAVVALGSIAGAFALQQQYQQAERRSQQVEAAAAADSAAVNVKDAFNRLVFVSEFLASGPLPGQRDFDDYLENTHILDESWISSVAFVEAVSVDALDELIERERRNGVSFRPRVAQGVSGTRYIITRKPSSERGLHRQRPHGRPFPPSRAHCRCGREEARLRAD